MQVGQAWAGHVGGGPGGQGFSSGGGTIDPRDQAIHAGLLGVGLSGPALATSVALPYLGGVALSALPGIDAAILGYLRKRAIAQPVQTGIVVGSGPALGYNLWRYGPSMATTLLHHLKSRGGLDKVFPAVREPYVNVPVLTNIGPLGPYGITRGITRPGLGGRRSRRAFLSRRRAKLGRERRQPWCSVHKRRHWCRYTR